MPWIFLDLNHQQTYDAMICAKRCQVQVVDRQIVILAASTGLTALDNHMAAYAVMQ